ncbi:ABC transporter substrate-binding protein [Xylanimonas oleitrophica]|uniref:ABC transporter substrate-binding protein n=1 Tax=Xylanimonas oleitrophica TaxID=2607479 RepID=UPI0015D0686F|nr:ABC transporter substrate-binding protein [Xylanimonas oleitrophica]
MTESSPRPRPGPRRLVLLAAAGAVVLAALVTGVLLLVRGGSSASDAAAATVPVALTAPGAPAGTTIGVVVTLGSDESQGAGWNRAAQGAAVAAHRFGLGGTDVTLLTLDDQGTVEGGRAAVQRLVDRGASGVVLATSGDHVQGALEASAAAGVPVVMPYADGEAAGADVWSTAPDEEQVAEALADALGGAERPLLVDAGGSVPAALPTAGSLAFRPGDDVTSLGQEVARLTGAAPAAPEDQTQGEAGGATFDAVVVAGPPTQQAVVVQALQAADVTARVVLTPEATSPAFAGALQERGGAVSSELVTVGADWDDAVALRQDAAGRAMSAFLGAVRLLAEEPAATNLTEDVPFAEVAGAADSRSHDAVVALVRAVAAAESTDPGKVADALGGLRLSARDGVAGPALDLTRRAVLDGEVRPLHASAQDLGLRPAAQDGTVRTVWFPAPVAQ